MINPKYVEEFLFGLVAGIVGLLFFHIDHLVVTYSGWNDPAWLLHLFVDSWYVVIYGVLGWLMLRGWRYLRK